MHSALRLLLLTTIVWSLPLHAQAPSGTSAEDILSTHFQVTVDGKPVPVLHAALNIYFLNIVAAKRYHIVVTAPVDGFWDRGVEVQPWRLNIRPEVQGKTISFDIKGEAKLTLSRPNDFLSEAEMLYIFANPPETAAPAINTPDLRYYGSGVHHENIDAQTGDTIYLAPGAIIFGSLNLWKVHHVKVFGRGVIVYDGPQNPADDDGWMHKPNWHCIVMDHAEDISIEGITCVVRSRTWQIQMAESRHILFDNVKVIGANPGNANADGMDWLGGGDTVVRNSFFRAADDVFALQSGWNGYSVEALADPGHPVTNILVENTVVSTSISNIVRAAWPRKNFVGGNFEMRNSDVLHAGLGGCGIPFALIEMWADPGGRGQSAGFHFKDIRLEDWYSLFQLEQPTAGIRDVSFTDVMAPEQPASVPSLVKGDVTGVTLDNVIAAGILVKQPADLPMSTDTASIMPVITNAAPIVTLRPVTGLVHPGRKIHFEATTQVAAKGLKYTWLFGDGKEDHRRKTSHRFPDTAGTLHDGSGRFRVMLHVTTPEGRSIWLSQLVLVTDTLLPPSTTDTGITATYTEVSATGERADAPPVVSQVSAFDLAAVPHRAEHYTVTFEGDVNALTDGAYRVMVFANDSATLTVDGKLTATAPAPFAQVCGLAGNAARPMTIYAPLARGMHRIKVTESHSTGTDDFRILWQGPDMPLQRISADSITRK